MIRLPLFMCVVIGLKASNYTILALNQAKLSNPALALQIGREKETLENLINFSFNENYDVYKSCSVLFNGKMMIFGGDDVSDLTTNKRVPMSVAVVDKCELKLLDLKMPLDMIVTAINNVLR